MIFKFYQILRTFFAHHWEHFTLKRVKMCCFFLGGGGGGGCPLPLKKIFALPPRPCPKTFSSHKVSPKSQLHLIQLERSNVLAQAQNSGPCKKYVKTP